MYNFPFGLGRVRWLIGCKTIIFGQYMPDLRILEWCIEIEVIENSSRYRHKTQK